MNLVAIVGRPNVGKSTLFNRLTKQKHAIVESVPGVTRDRIYGKSDWNGVYFTVIDTGGFIPGTADTMERAVREQAHLAIDEAESIIFLVDGRDGPTGFDEDIAGILRKSEKPVTLVVNKCDNAIQDEFSHEFYKLGVGDPYPISALNGRNTGDFLDRVVESLKEIDEQPEDERLKIAFVGRPNAGKSSLANALLGKPRSIVTEIPGTTRDSIDSVLKHYGEEIVIIDTAGLRKRSKVRENIELYSILRTGRAIERSDVAVVLLDAERGLEDQDKKIINMVEERRKGIIVAYNKWDLIEKDKQTADKFRKEFYESLGGYAYAPIFFVSALTKQRITKIIETAKAIKKRRETKIKTSELNDVLLKLLAKTPPPAVKGRDIKINYVAQTGVSPPIFTFFCNRPHLLKDNYKRFIERVLRENFDFSGTPVSFIFRRKNPVRE